MRIHARNTDRSTAATHAVDIVDTVHAPLATHVVDMIDTVNVPLATHAVDTADTVHAPSNHARKCFFGREPSVASLHLSNTTHGI